MSLCFLLYNLLYMYICFKFFSHQYFVISHSFLNVLYTRCLSGFHCVVTLHFTYFIEKVAHDLLSVFSQINFRVKLYSVKFLFFIANTWKTILKCSSHNYLSKTKVHKSIYYNLQRSDHCPNIIYLQLIFLTEQ